MIEKEKACRNFLNPLLPFVFQHRQRLLLGQMHHLTQGMLQVYAIHQEIFHNVRTQVSNKVSQQVLSRITPVNGLQSHL